MKGYAIAVSTIIIRGAKEESEVIKLIIQTYTECKKIIGL